MLLQIEHETVYRYARPVELGPHRLMLRAMEGHDVQIRSSKLIIIPKYKIRWIHDVFGNSIALLNLLEPTTELSIYSQLIVDQFNTNPFDFVLDKTALQVPFAYPEAEELETGPYRQIQYGEDTKAVEQWIKPFLKLDGRANTLDFLLALNKSFPYFFQYVRREELGVQTPGETLRKRAGSCRDFALLLMEAARHVGLAARFVSGYLCHRQTEATPDPASNATHAWTEVYLPGAGWKGFDPTSGILAADLHVRVAVARQPSQAAPVSGIFRGASGDNLGLDVRVNAHVLEEDS